MKIKLKRSKRPWFDNLSAILKIWKSKEISKLQKLIDTRRKKFLSGVKLTSYVLDSQFFLTDYTGELLNDFYILTETIANTFIVRTKPLKIPRCVVWKNFAKLTGQQYNATPIPISIECPVCKKILYPIFDSHKMYFSFQYIEETSPKQDKKDIMNFFLRYQKKCPSVLCRYISNEKKNNTITFQEIYFLHKTKQNDKELPIDCAEKIISQLEGTLFYKGNYSNHENRYSRNVQHRILRLGYFQDKEIRLESHVNIQAPRPYEEDKYGPFLKVYFFKDETNYIEVRSELDMSLTTFYIDLTHLKLKKDTKIDCMNQDETNYLYNAVHEIFKDCFINTEKTIISCDFNLLKTLIYLITG